RHARADEDRDSRALALTRAADLGPAVVAMPFLTYSIRHARDRRKTQTCGARRSVAPRARSRGRPAGAAFRRTGARRADARRALAVECCRPARAPRAGADRCGIRAH